MCVLEYRRTAIAMNKPLKSGLVFDANFEHPTFQGATAPTRDTQGVASLALGILCSWPNFTLFFYVNKSIAKSITRIWPLVVLA